LLDRSLIIATEPYSDEELTKILEIRCEEEDVTLTEKAKSLLTKLCQTTSLRYAIQLITASALVAQKRKATEVDMIDLRKVYELFVDVKRSTNFLKEYQSEYLYNTQAKETMDTSE
jgi:RuvB-like protein 2